MLQKKRIKVSICLSLVLLMLIAFSGPSALAADSKVVTITQTYNFTCPDYAISYTMTAIPNTTYNYNDGTYKGTLKFAGYANYWFTYAYKEGNNNFYNCTAIARFTGTVTSY